MSSRVSRAGLKQEIREILGIDPAPILDDSGIPRGAPLPYSVQNLRKVVDPSEQSAVRTALREILRRHGVTERMKGERRRSAEVYDRLDDDGGTNAEFQPNGNMLFTRRSWDALVSALRLGPHLLGKRLVQKDPKAAEMIKALATGIHESVHESGPAYALNGRFGQVPEEIVTEGAAQRILGLEIGYDTSRFRELASYRPMIQGCVEQLAHIADASMDRAGEAFYEACLDFKRGKLAQGARIPSASEMGEFMARRMKGSLFPFVSGENVLRNVAVDALRRLGAPASLAPRLVEAWAFVSDVTLRKLTGKALSKFERGFFAGF